MTPAYFSKIRFFLTALLVSINSDTFRTDHTYFTSHPSPEVSPSVVKEEI